MAVVRGCSLPDELLYDVDNHIWFQEQADGTVKMGMTAVATAMAGQLVAFTPRKAGRSVQAGKSCATVESGKWVGPAKSLAGGEIAAVNEALVAKPALANEDPYGAGWLVILKPEDWDAVRSALTPGSQVTAKYEAKMAADGFAGCA
ncbi:MAG: glycine cleavage system protein H [Betaproteobacteria bacterium]